VQHMRKRSKLREQTGTFTQNTFDSFVMHRVNKAYILCSIQDKKGKFRKIWKNTREIVSKRCGFKFEKFMIKAEFVCDQMHIPS
jgi:hypothetical protein